MLIEKTTDSMANDMREKRTKNWTDNAASYSNLVQQELRSFKREAWLRLLRENSGKQGRLDVLDVGCGPGFFAILMAQEGHIVSAVDCTAAMLTEAEKNAESENVNVRFAVSDTQNLPFADETFDLVISRNVAWTLHDAGQTYREWRRVLRPGCRALIFDANWNRHLFDEQLAKEYEKINAEYKLRYGEEIHHGFTQEMLDYRRGLPMCGRIRPQWDFGALVEADYQKIFCDRTVWKSVYDEREQFGYSTQKMFMLAAEK